MTSLITSVSEIRRGQGDLNVCLIATEQLRNVMTRHMEVALFLPAYWDYNLAVSDNDIKF